MKSFLILPVFVLLAFTCNAQTKLAAKDAGKHSGQSVMICDKVYNTEPVTGTNQTLLHLGSETGQYLTVVVKGSNQPKLLSPQRTFYWTYASS